MTSVKLDPEVRWYAPGKYAATLDVSVDEDFAYQYRVGKPEAFMASLLSPCCKRAYASSHYRPGQEPAYCPQCFVTSPYAGLAVAHRASMDTSAAWFRPALELYYDPLTSVLLAEDLQYLSKRVFKRWCDLQGFGDRHFMRMLHEPVEVTLATLVEEFTGPLRAHEA